MEIKNLCLADTNCRVLETEEDGEVRLYLLTEIDLEAVLYAMPASVERSVYFRHLN